VLHPWVGLLAPPTGVDLRTAHPLNRESSKFRAGHWCYPGPTDVGVLEISGRFRPLRCIAALCVSDHLVGEQRQALPSPVTPTVGSSSRSWIGSALRHPIWDVWGGTKPSTWAYLVEMVVDLGGHNKNPTIIGPKIDLC
jgi:hypothetical protein